MDRIPVPVVSKDLEVFHAAIENDTEFLCKLGVIDYSLLLAFDENNRQLFVGVIDYIHQYDINGLSFECFNGLFTASRTETFAAFRI